MARVALVLLLCTGCGRVADSGAAPNAQASSPSPGGQASPTPCQGPAARITSLFSYDSERREGVLFGGHGKGIFGDTWLWSGSCWRLAATTNSPAARSS